MAHETPMVIRPPASETRRFWQTSEFWLAVLTNLATIGAAMADILPPKYAVPVMAVTNGLYALARGLAKQGVAPQSQGSTVVVNPHAPVTVEKGP